MKKLFSLALFATCMSAGIANAAITPENLAVFSKSDNAFPLTRSSYLKQPMPVDVAQTSKIAKGLTKDSVRLILNVPHFHEFKTSQWNYWLNIRVPNTNNYMECQLQLDFDGNPSKVVAGRWSTPACAKLAYNVAPPVERVVVREVPVPVVQPAIVAPVVRDISLQTDALFAYNSSDVKDINALGRSQLLKLVRDLNTAPQEIKSIHISGYTDRIGSDKYNLELSQRRADTIKAFLLDNGLKVQSDLVTAVGHGKSHQATCSDNQSKDKLIACLAPDRRIDVHVDR